MFNTYFNPAFPIQNKTETISEQDYSTKTLNINRLDENKTVKDIFKIYFYENCSDIEQKSEK